MTKKELIDKLETIHRLRDENPAYECWGSEAADLVCKYLESIGHKDIVEKYDNEMMYGSSSNACRILDDALDEFDCEDIPTRLRIY